MHVFVVALPTFQYSYKCSAQFHVHHLQCQCLSCPLISCNPQNFTEYDNMCRICTYLLTVQLEQFITTCMCFVAQIIDNAILMKNSCIFIVYSVEPNYTIYLQTIVMLVLPALGLGNISINVQYHLIKYPQYNYCMHLAFTILSRVVDVLFEQIKLVL